MKKIMLGFLLLAFTNLHAQTKKSADMEKSVAALHHTIMQAIKNKQDSVLQTSILPDFIFTSATAELWNKEKFINGFALSPNIQFPVFAPQDQQVIIHDNTAVLIALVHIKIIRSAGATPEEFWERTTETYIKQSGEWKLLALQATFKK